jgi:plasmid stabilization system protein ParE
MRIRYSPRAVADLDAVHRYLTERNPVAADAVLAAIHAAVEFIRQNPHAAEATRIPGVRGKIVQGYRFNIFYRLVTNDVIEIAHIRHASRRPWTGED